MRTRYRQAWPLAPGLGVDCGRSDTCTCLAHRVAALDSELRDSGVAAAAG